MHMYMYNCSKLNCTSDAIIITYSIVHLDLKCTCICTLYTGISITFYNINAYVEKYST